MLFCSCLERENGGWTAYKKRPWDGPLIQHIYTSLAMIPMKRYTHTNYTPGEAWKGGRRNIVGANYGVECIFTGDVRPLTRLQRLTTVTSRQSPERLTCLAGIGLVEQERS